MSADTRIVVVKIGAVQAYIGVLQGSEALLQGEQEERVKALLNFISKSKRSYEPTDAYGLVVYASFAQALAEIPGIEERWTREYGSLEYKVPLVVLFDGDNVRELRPRYEDAVMWT